MCADYATTKTKITQTYDKYFRFIYFFQTVLNSSLSLSLSILLPTIENECEASAPLSRDGIDGQADDDYPIGEAITTPSTSRGRPKGSTSTQKISKSKAAKHASFSAEIETYDNQPTILNIQTNVLHTVDEKVNIGWNLHYRHSLAYRKLLPAFDFALFL